MSLRDWDLTAESGRETFLQLIKAVLTLQLQNVAFNLRMTAAVHLQQSSQAGWEMLKYRITFPNKFKHNISNL